MKKIVIFTASLVTLVTGGWAATKPGWDSVSALGAASVALLSAFLIPSKKEPSGQNQTIGDNSNGIQAGRDVKIR